MGVPVLRDGAAVTLNWFNSVALTVNSLTNLQVVAGTAVITLDKSGYGVVSFKRSGLFSFNINPKKQNFSKPPVVIITNGDTVANGYGIVLGLVQKNLSVNRFEVQAYDSAGKIGNKSGYVIATGSRRVRVNFVAFSSK